MVSEKPGNRQRYSESRKDAPESHMKSWPDQGSRTDSRNETLEIRSADAITKERIEVKASDPQVAPSSKQRLSTSTRIPKLPKNFWNRKNEEDKILQAYEAMLRGENRSLFLITGAPGTGKTTLAKCALQDRVVADGGYFITGKFDQLRRPEPYRAFVMAFSDFTAQVEWRGSAVVVDMKRRIREALGDEICVLTSMIPALQRIIVAESEHSYLATGNDVMQHFMFVFRTFLRSISSTQQPLVLLVDDLHYADECSLDILTNIIIDLRNMPGFFVLATCGQSVEWNTDGSYLWRRLRNVRKWDNPPFTQVLLCNLNDKEVTSLLGRVLNLSSLELGKNLGQLIHRHTNGNLFNISELLSFLHDMGLLLFDLKTGSWFWDDDEICTKMDERANGEFILSKLQNINRKEQEVLKVAACLGSEINESLIANLLGHPVRRFLEAAVDSGIVCIKQWSGSFMFEHDILQSVIYNLIPQSEMELFHLEIGRRIWRVLNQQELDKYLFVLLSQLYIGRRLIWREEERSRVASLCLQAGKKAAKCSTFRTASVYFNFGIELVKDRGWEEEYNMTLSLYNAAAEMELCTTNYEKMEMLIQTVIKKAKQPHDKVQAQVTQLYAMGITERQQEAIEMGMDLLCSLGEPLPKHLGKLRLALEFLSIKWKLKRISNERILRLPLMENREKLACMQVLNILALNAILARPDLSPFVALKITDLTLQNGLSLIAPGGFAMYAVMCIVALGDFDSAFRFGDLSMELLRRSDQKEYLPRVYATYYGCISPWRSPVRETLEPLLHAHLVGLQTGDHEFSALCANLYCFNAFDAGVPLDTIEEKWTSFQESMANNRQQALLRMAVPYMQANHHYMGLTPDPLASKGDLIDLDEALQFAIDHKIQSTIVGISALRMTISCLFGAMDQADKFSKLCLPELMSMPPSMGVIYVLMCGGLTAVAMAMKGGPWRRRQKYIQRAKKALRWIQKCTILCPANFLAMKYLLEAEIFAYQKNARAVELYVSAIGVAKQFGLVHIEAQANERMARYLVRQEKLVAAEPYFREACKLYEKWKAHAKVQRLQEEIDQFYNTE